MHHVSLRKSSLLTAILTCVLGSLAFADSLTDKVDALFAEWDKPDSPGCALGIVQNGKLVYKRGYGMASLEHGVPISSQTVFRIASASKQFTAASVLLAAERGYLSLDDDIRKYLPELPDYGAPITIRHLIHHTSGLRDRDTLTFLATGRYLATGEETVQLLARQKALNFKPGDEHSYSNTGYFLMGQIVKRTTGKSLRAFAEENIFKPLGMNNTHFHDDRTMVVKNRAAGYSPRKEGGFRLNWSTNDDTVGDGGLLTTVEDLFLWDQNFYENELGGKNFVRHLLSPGKLNTGEKLDYAYGLYLTEYKTLRIVTHPGSWRGFRAELLRFPEQKFSFICLCNVSNASAAQRARRVADLYLTHQLKEQRAAVVDLAEQELKDKTGVYLDSLTGGVVKLTVKEGNLTANVFGWVFPLVPVSQTQFRPLGVPAYLTIRFERAVANNPWRLQLNWGLGKPVTLEAIQVVSPTPAELKEYVGGYYSDELQATYNVLLQDGKLTVKRKNAPPELLEPTLRDQFSSTRKSFKFIRNNENQVTGFTLNAGRRVMNVHFVRKAS